MLHAHEMQTLADEHGVNDIFQDSGGKVLQILIMLSAQCIPGRMGSDIFWIGSDTELKTLNTRLGNSGFTTHRRLDAAVLARYRSEPWVFCICDGIEVVEAWWVHPARLETVFAGWDEKLERKKLDGKDPYINNPKIPMKLIREVGCPIDMSASI